MGDCSLISLLKSTLFSVHQSMDFYGVSAHCCYREDNLMAVGAHVKLIYNPVLTDFESQFIPTTVRSVLDSDPI